MPDIFDEIENENKGDVFDKISIQSPSDEYEQFKQNYISEKNKPFLSKTGDVLKGGANVLFNLGKTVLTAPYNLTKGLSEIAGKSSASESPVKEFAGDITQSTIEGVAEPTYDMLNTGRQLVNYIEDKRKEKLNAAIANNEGRIQPSSGKITEEEIENAFLRDLKNKAYEEIRQSNIAPTLTGEVNPSFKQAVVDVPAAFGVAGAIKGLARKAGFSGLSDLSNTGLARGAQKIANAAEEVSTKAVKSVTGSVVPKTIEDDFLTALDPRAQALSPKKGAMALENVKAAIKDALPDLDNIYKKGYSLDTAQNATDAAQVALKDIWKERQALVGGTPIKISYDPIADIYDKMAMNPIIQRRFGDGVVKKLQDIADRYRGVKVTAEEAELENRVFNATVESKLAELPRVDKSKLLQSNPLINADLEASKVLKEQLENAIGKDFPDLGKRYGAWRQISDYATQQAARQFKMENRPGFMESMATIGAARDVLSNPISAGLQYGAGKLLKYGSSPDAKFQFLDQRIRSSLSKGKLKSRPPTASSLNISPRSPDLPPGVFDEGLLNQVRLARKGSIPSKVPDELLDAIDREFKLTQELYKKMGEKGN